MGGLIMSVLTVLILFAAACILLGGCKVAGDCSREEEQRHETD